MGIRHDTRKIYPFGHSERTSAARERGIIMDLVKELSMFSTIVNKDSSTFRFAPGVRNDVFGDPKSLGIFLATTQELVFYEGRT
jgi:hypothetical protein